MLLILVSVVELANGDSIYLRSFQSSKISQLLTFVNENGLVDDEGTIHATGGGSYKYQQEFQSIF